MTQRLLFMQNMSLTRVFCQTVGIEKKVNEEAMIL